MERDSTAAHRLALLRGLAVVAVLLAAVFPRARHLEASFDREADGQRGARAALTRLNSERMPQLDRPITAIELPAGSTEFDGIGEPPWEEQVRVPDSPLGLDLALETAGFALLDVDPRRTDAPTEFAVRLPFLLVHVLALLAWWWALRGAAGGQVALLALAFLAVLPPSVAYASLAGTENLALLGAALVCGVHARALRRRSLALGVATVVLALAVTAGMPQLVALVALLPVHALLERRPRAALGLAAGIGLPLGALLGRYAPEELHGFAERVAPRLAGAGTLFGDVLDGFTPPLALLAALALVLQESRRLGAGWRARLEALEFPTPAPDRVGLGALLLAAGAGAALLTESAGGSRLLLLAPAVALGLALALQQLTRPMARMRAGLAPLVVAVSLLAMPALARFGAFEAEYRAEPTPRTLGAELRELEVYEQLVCAIPASLYAGPALEYYARRSLVPQDLLDRAEIGSVAVKRGILPWKPSVLVPAGTQDPAEPQDVRRLRAAARSGGELRDATERWEVWVLR